MASHSNTASSAPPNTAAVIHIVRQMLSHVTPGYAGPVMGVSCPEAIGLGGFGYEASTLVPKTEPTVRRIQILSINSIIGRRYWRCTNKTK